MRKILYIFFLFILMPLTLMAQNIGGEIKRESIVNKPSYPLRIENAQNMTCELNSGVIGVPCINKTTRGKYIIPSIIDGYTITKIGEHAFQDCDKITSIVLPESILAIGQNAFFNCTSLTEISLPKRIKKLESNTFSYCSSLVSVILPANLEELNGFWSCSSLKRIEIPKSVRNIHWGCFVGCKSLATVVSNIEDPFNIDEEDPFHGISPDAILYVPKGSRPLYINAGWGKYFSQIIEQNG